MVRLEARATPRASHPPGRRAAMTPGQRILIADDDPDVLEALRLLLKNEGYQVETATSPGKVLGAVEARDFDAILIDMNYTRDTTGGIEGLDLLSRLQALDNTLPVMVMTAWGSIEGAVEAMRRGARDYIEKPWNNARLLNTLRTHIELGRAIRASQRLETENRSLRKDGVPELIADSPAMQPVLRLMERVGPSDANALITGEHGTGKEVVARWLHGASPRASKSLVTVNVGGLAEGVFESELFGHVKGAFTDAKTDRVGRFEAADGGTMLLDEVGNLSLTQQARLLRVLQAGEFERVGSSKTRQANVRVLAATNADLRSEVAAGRFREDLLFRLNTIEIHLPPLRDRREDILPLVQYFLQRHAARYGKRRAGISPEAAQLLRAYDWPGNVRELDHAVERAVLLARLDTLESADFSLAQPTARAGLSASSPMNLEDLERETIRQALARHDGNVSLAAKALGLSRSALYRRLQRYGL